MNNTILLYKEDNFMIKYNKIEGTYFYYKKEQNKNKRNNHLITFNNETKTLFEWAKEYSINPFTLLNRINAGWDIKKALNKKVARYKKFEL